MNIGELKKIIETLDDSMPVVYSGGDHNYFDSMVFVLDAEVTGRHSYLEYNSEEEMFDKTNKVIKILVID